MLNDWFREIGLPMTRQQFEALPRHPAYKYEYADGRAILSPSPRYGRALLDFAALDQQRSAHSEQESGCAEIRPLSESDWDLLPGLMKSAFHDVPPFSALDEVTALTAAADCIRTTRTGGDGPVVHEGCLVAVGSQPWENPIGAVLITLIPSGDLAQWHGTRWSQPPPADSVQRRLGRPHLTWIFVSPWHSGSGLGSELLRASVAALRQMGYAEMASTFLVGNDRSLAWHWRNGFRLLRHPGSLRRGSEPQR